MTGRDAAPPAADPAAHALAADPDDPLALQRLGVAAHEAGDWVRAVRLFTRAGHLHGDGAAVARQVGAAVAAARGHAAGLLEFAGADAAAAVLDPLARVVAPAGDVARTLGTIRLIQGRDDEARRCHAAAGEAARDGGLEVALQGLARAAAENAVIGTVVIPVFRMEDTIVRALDSVAAAIAHLRAASGDPTAQVHICVVDDASPDASAERALAWARAHPDLSVAVIAHSRNGGAGRCRNAGAAAARGRYLWFLDADDRYFPPHLHLTAATLDRTPGAGFVRTAMHFEGIDAEVTADWRTASETSYPCNLCVRRDCHALTGGFPEEAPFHPAVADDVAYARALHSLFGGVKLAQQTVHYSMRPGNALARQRAEMTGGAPAAGRVNPDARFQAIEILTRRRLHAVDARRRQLIRSGGWTGPPLLDPPATAEAPAQPPTPPMAPPPPCDDPAVWVERGRAALGAGAPEQGLARLARAAALAPDHPVAWFEAGLAAHRAGLGPRAERAFRAVAALSPGAAAARFNLATLRFDREAYAAAAAALGVAMALRPDHADTLLLLARSLRRLGRPGEALALLVRGDRLQPARPDLDAERAVAEAERGADAVAVRLGRRAVAGAPDACDGHAALGAALEAAGRPDPALAAWERAILCHPGRAEGFTGRAVNLLTRRWGPPPAPAPRGAPGRRLASTALGRHGRFGNQLLQYGVLRLYAARHGLTLEVPPWIGRHLYDRDDPLPGPALPRLAEAAVEETVLAALGGGAARLPADHDATAYFCGHTGVLAPVREEFRALFAPGRHLRPHAEAVAARLRAAGRTVVALHIRRGDFGWGRFWTAPESWYLRWLEDVWPGLADPVLVVATDDPATLRAFAAYRPLTGRDLAPPLAGAEFFADFHALCVADRVAVSNSSFSFVATMLNRAATAFMRPDRDARALVPYDPWSAPVLA